MILYLLFFAGITTKEIFLEKLNKPQNKKELLKEFKKPKIIKKESNNTIYKYLNIDKNLPVEKDITGLKENDKECKITFIFNKNDKKIINRYYSGYCYKK